jgi:hypothetical protein
MNKCYARIAEDVLTQGYCIDEDSFELTKNMYPQDTFIEVPLLVSPETHYVSNNIILEKPEKPGEGYYWNNTSNTWVIQLSTIKNLKWNKIKQARDRAEFGGFIWDGSGFDSDAISQQRISGAVQLAMINPSYTVDWTLSNNTTRTLSAQDIVAVGISLGNHVSAQHEKSRLLREQINLATTVEQVNAITW